MAPRVVHLHIGSTKTGTTFIQRVLWANKETLAANGVMLPARGQPGLGAAARALHAWRPEDGPIPGAWMKVARTITRATSNQAIVSQEFLSWLDPDQVMGMVSTLEGIQVKVVMTTRDLARLIPAQWQSAMRQRNTWTLTEYAHSIQHGDDRDGRHTPHQHFWHRMDYGRILRSWADVVGLENVTVVTVPPSGADPDELWRRFCAATDLDAGRYTTTGIRNASLGAVSCEVLRRLNGLPTIQEMPRKDYGAVINSTLTRRVLDAGTRPEPKVTLPDGQRTWVLTKAEEMIADLEAVGPRLIGSLDDLRPRPPATRYQAPEDLPADDLLDVALEALAGLASLHHASRSTPEPRSPEPRKPPRATKGAGRRSRRA